MAPIAPHTLSNRPIVLADTGEVTIDLVSGRDASANFDMQSLASLLIGDRITVKRSNYHARFLHPAVGAITTPCAKNCTGMRAVHEPAAHRFARFRDRART